MLDILLHVLLFNKVDWDSVSVVSGKISLESVNSGCYDIINMSYRFYKLNKKINLKNLYKITWCNYLFI